jgi:hypothetical protein
VCPDSSRHPQRFKPSATKELDETGRGQVAGETSGNAGNDTSAHHGSSSYSSSSSSSIRSFAGRWRPVLKGIGKSPESSRFSSVEDERSLSEIRACRPKVENEDDDEYENDSCWAVTALLVFLVR